MKRDFSQPFHTSKPNWAYVLAEYSQTGQFLLLKVIADEQGDEWYTVPGLEVPKDENTALLLAKALDRYGLVLESFREVARETRVSYSFVDDTLGEQREYVCIHALVDAVRSYKSEDTKVEFASLDRIIELATREAGELSSIIGVGASAINHASYNIEAVQDAGKKVSSNQITNFTIFDQSKLNILIEPFVPGMSPHITPIKYEALTPDMYCFLFRTLGKDDQYYYFVLLEYDFISDLEHAEGIVAKWHGAVLEFVPPHEAQAEVTPSLENLSYPYDKIYKGLLGRVERPVGDGYWAAHLILKPGEDVDATLAHLPEERRNAIKRGLAEIKNKKARVSVYVKPEGGYELFSN